MNSQTSSVRVETDPIVLVDAICGVHGAYKAKRMDMSFIGGAPIQSKCPACAEERAAKERAEKERQKALQREAEVRELFGCSGIPARFADRSLTNYVASTDGQKRALKIAERFVDSFLSGDVRGASLVLAGKPGTGKTHIACGIGRALIGELYTVQFMTVLRAIRHIKETYRRDSDRSETDAIRDLTRPDLLILDEVGAQVGSEHEKMLMFEVINERYQECRSTILISNLTGDELSEFLGDRAMDRFREAGGIVAFDWPSFRGKRA
ncbi:ATP-binding protein [Coralloluteibacterium thermophilus]|uniref:ATP-binding protein n=1 Tax=Coralloluteibacterium thermophilum TaxID=2707049 RepID=A0ABV9NQE9_9GAMM